MTNIEKFEEVFGFKPPLDGCVMPNTICTPYSHSDIDICEGCIYGDWWDWIYRPDGLELIKGSEMNVMLDKGAYLPERAHDLDAGYDLRTPYDVDIPATVCCGETNYVAVGCAVIDTGVHIEIPAGHTAFLKSKSGLNVKHNIIGEGVVDAGYSGSVVVKLYNLNNAPYHFDKGDKIIQLVILPIATPTLKIVDKFAETERGNGGFGSSGK